MAGSATAEASAASISVFRLAPFANRLLHRLDVFEEGLLIANRGDVDDDQLLDEIGVPQRHQHRRLAADAVAQNGRRRQPVLFDQRLEVVGHLRIGHAVRPGRVAVIAQIAGEDAIALGQPLRHRMPVLRRAEQAVQDDDRRPLAVFAKGER